MSGWGSSCCAATRATSAGSGRWTPKALPICEVPYRTLSRPAISVWEQQAAVARLRELGRAEVDEHALFAMVTQMREITDTAAATTRKARRDRQRRAAVPPVPGTRIRRRRRPDVTRGGPVACAVRR